MYLHTCTIKKIIWRLSLLAKEQRVQYIPKTTEVPLYFQFHLSVFCSSVFFYTINFPTMILGWYSQTSNELYITLRIFCTFNSFVQSIIQDHLNHLILLWERPLPPTHGTSLILCVWIQYYLNPNNIYLYWSWIFCVADSIWCKSKINKVVFQTDAPLLPSKSSRHIST